ncbi:neutral/alkaline non-lysosomal ceramidase N-terminal domain-containing protein [Deltaproteobacteria bacterium TL4]
MKKASIQKTVEATACEYLIGSGIHDITGPVKGVGMMGYAMPEQLAKGLHTRLWARAFIVVHPDSNKRVVFVNTDLWAITHLVKVTVVERLQAIYGDLYHEENTLLGATHTHSGPGGYSSYLLYNFTIFGFSYKNFEIIVNGITQAIIKAHGNLDWGKIYINRGELLNTSINRSKEAYQENAEHVDYPHDTNKEMTILKFVKATGDEIGMIDWFAVHSTSMNKYLRYISSDNKGHAEYLFERDKGTDYQAAETFVAAFANSEQGDVSPNVDGLQSKEDDSFKRTQNSGIRQYQKAKELYASATELITGEIDFCHQWVKMPGYRVRHEFTKESEQVLGYGAKGISFAAGSGIDGPSNVPGMEEGTRREARWNTLSILLSRNSVAAKMLQLSVLGISKLAQDPMHYPKPVLLPTGKISATPWTPQTLPFQLLKIGQLTLIAVPGEMTTTCGRRLKAEVLNVLQSQGVSHAVITGLANMYSGYITTTEEYQLQRYEGASTHFGPYTSAAYQQIYSGLAQAMASHKVVESEERPEAVKPWFQLPDVFMDIGSLANSLGAVVQQPNASYVTGETVASVFKSVHPKHHLMTQSTYLKVEVKTERGWKMIATDNDWDTTIQWLKDVSGTLVKIEWHIPSNTAKGEYRIVHQGFIKTLTKEKLYQGMTQPFQVK